MKTDTPWAARLDLLMSACGWTNKRAAEKFGCFTGSIAKMLKGEVPMKRGGGPDTRLILRLRTLEEAYAGEIEAWKRGEITRMPGCKQRDKRIDWRSHIAAMGVLGALGEAPLLPAAGGSIRGGVPLPPTEPPIVVRLAPAFRDFFKKNRKIEPGRPALEPGGPGESVA